MLMVKERFKARVIPTLFRRKKKVDGVTVLLCFEKIVDEIIVLLASLFFGSVDGVTVLLLPL
jgi:hypothetical protein